MHYGVAYESVQALARGYSAGSCNGAKMDFYSKFSKVLCHKCDSKKKNMIQVHQVIFYGRI